VPTSKRNAQCTPSVGVTYRTSVLIDPVRVCAYQVCDEAHLLKNAKTGSTMALMGTRTSMRVALTGSPLQNNLLEYYCMVNFVREGFLGSTGDFRNRFVNPICNGQMEDSTKQDVRMMKYRAHVLHRKLEGFVQRKGVAVLRRQVRIQTIAKMSDHTHIAHHIHRPGT